MPDTKSVGGRLLTVVAALEPADGSLFPSMIDAIKRGQSLPTEFVAKLPIVE